MARFHITALDHIVLNVGDVDRSLRFYTEILGLRGERVEEFRAGRVGFPSVRINDTTIIDLFPAQRTGPAEGAKCDRNLNHFCMVVDTADLASVVDDLAASQIAVREGPVSRWGARGRATSVYFPDPDGNEIEIRAY